MSKSTLTERCNRVQAVALHEEEPCCSGSQARAQANVSHVRPPAAVPKREGGRVERTKSDHFLSGGWRQYERFSDALSDHRKRTSRLITNGALDEEATYLFCGSRACGLGNMPPAGRSSPSPFQCSAFCRIAQFRWEANQTPRLARLLYELDPKPLFVTVINPRYRIPLEQMKNFSTSGIKQSMGRSLLKIRQITGRSVVAVGRIDFDVTGEPDDLQIRPHVHFLVANATAADLRKHLQPRFNRRDYPNFKPVMIKPAVDIGALRYSTKSALKGLPNTSEVPSQFLKARIRTPAHADRTFDEWLADQSFSDLLILHGIRRDGDRFRLLE